MTRIKKHLSSKPVWIGFGAVVLTLVLWSANAAPFGETRIFARNSIPAQRTEVAEQPIQPLIARQPGPLPAAMPATPAVPDSLILAPAPSLAELPEVELDNSGNLNAHRDFALGMIESGNDDQAVGQLGEVSRYQIMPSVWKHYSESRSYGDREAALKVARQHWKWLHEYFEARARRAATDFDMYVLWNTRYGYYAGKGFDPNRLHPVVKDRAERFANLVERGAD